MTRIRGVSVIGFVSKGCMAHVHQFSYLGKVVGFEDTRFAGKAARVQVIKRGDDGIDYRDADLGFEIEPIHNPAFYEIAPDLWMIIR